MLDSSTARVKAVIEVIAEHNVAMRNELAKFEADRKLIDDAYTRRCKELTTEKNSRLARLAVEETQNG